MFQIDALARRRSAHSAAVLLAVSLLSLQAHAQYDWLQFGFLPDKTGNNTLETDINLGDVATLQPLFTAPLSHNPDGAPVLLTGVNTPSGVRNLIFSFAEQGYTTAFDANTGAQVWTKDYSAGSAGQSSNTSPAIDPNRLYVYTFGMDGNVHKLNVGDGSEVTGGGWPERIMNDNGKARGALTIATAANGHTYLYGNAEGSQGHMTTIDLGTGAQHTFNTSNAQDPDTHSPTGGYGDANPWSRGPAYNAALDRVFFTTGTYASFVAGHDWAESLLGMSPDGSTNLVNGGGYPVDSYTPTAWQTYVNDDADLGSANIIQLPAGLSSKYPHLAVMGSKDTTIRIFNLANLSGQGAPGNLGGELEQIAGPNGGLIRSQGTTWTDPATGNVWVFVPGNNGICGLIVAIDGSGNPSLVTKWTLNNGWTTSAIVANGVLFAAVGGGEHTDTTSTHYLQAINPLTGAVVWSAAIGQFHWASPIVANGIVYMTDGNSGGFGTGTGGNLHAWSLGGTCNPTPINAQMNVGGVWTAESSATVASTTAVVDLGPQPLTGGSWSWIGPGGFTSTAREIDNIKLSAGANVYTATYTNSCGAKSTQAFTITVSGGSTGSFSLKASAATLSVVQGASATDTITVTDVSPFAGSVTLAASGLPTGVTAAFAPNPTSTTSMLTLTASSSAAAGASTVTITGTSGSLSATTTISLTVTKTSGTLIANGTYIVTAVNSGSALDDPGSSKTNGTDMQIYTVNDGTNQQWTVNNVSANVITLTNVSSGQLLDVAGASKTSGALVDQWPANGQTNQEWNVISLGGGNYELTSVNSGLALSVVGGGTANKTGVEQLTYSGSTSQQWKFTSY